MNSLNQLIESLLLEAALTKGSQRVLSDKKLVAGLADAMRDDVRSNPMAFPPGSKATFKKADDQALAEWFLENIDKIEQEGYEGTIYSRDGVNSEWIVRRYIAGSHSWEDITGVMNMNLRDWYLLKNRNMLDANHRDLPKFNSVRDVGYYMTTHYKNELEKVRDAAKNAARNKMAKSVKLVDNDDYRIYTTLNRAAGCAIGLGTQWCTANSNDPGHYHNYSKRAMLFQLFPYIEKKNPETGEKELVLNDNEKYQFDAGGPSFMNITDNPVSATVIAQKFPYLYNDLIAGLRSNKSKIEKLVKDSNEDPLLQNDDAKVKNYNIDAEIKKLDNLKERGYFTDETRPRDNQPQDAARASAYDAAWSAARDAAWIGEPAAEQPPQEPQMESIRDLADAMLEEVTLGHIVRSFKPHNQDGKESPMTYGEDNLDEEEVNECDAAKARLTRALGGQSGMVDEDEMQDAGNQAATGGSGSMGSMGSMGAGGNYSPGTAPTMPESIQIKENKMNNVDKDVAAMLNSLKKYDKLTESVLGMTTLSMARPVVAETSQQRGQANDQQHAENAFAANRAQKRRDADEQWAKSKGSIKEDDMEEGNEFSGKLAKAKAEHKKSFEIGGRTVPVKEAGTDKSKVPAVLRKEKGGDWKTSKADLDREASKSPTTKKGLEDLKAKKDIKETADPEILEWMNRFSKLGNMKGYGR